MAAEQSASQPRAPAVRRCTLGIIPYRTHDPARLMPGTARPASSGWQGSPPPPSASAKRERWRGHQEEQRGERDHNGRAGGGVEPERQVEPAANRRRGAQLAFLKFFTGAIYARVREKGKDDRTFR